jgi:catechol 2,3-dioxygenase-like lactoylglutathione lyase family enzyme
VADLAAFLASDDSSCMTAEVVISTGGTRTSHAVGEAVVTNGKVNWVKFARYPAAATKRSTKGERLLATFEYDHVHLASQEPAKTIEFLAKHMGARVTRRGGTPSNEMIDLDLGGITLRISKTTGADDNRFGLHHVGLKVADLRATISELKSAGSEIVVERFPDPPGIPSAFIRLPDGLLVEVKEAKRT